MPEELKPVWIDGYYDNKAAAASALQRHLIGTALEGVPMPVLTLDQLETWLTSQRNNPQLGAYRASAVDSLLAQMQAWKESGKLTPSPSSGIRGNHG